MERETYDIYASETNAAQARGYGILGQGQATMASRAPEAPVTDEAERALSAAEGIHGALNDLEYRLFGPTLQGVEGKEPMGPDKARPPIARTVRNARQRIESASERLNAIIARL